jgi:HEPN domain-containing protein
METLSFHAQQAAEKSLKAVLIGAGVEVPKIPTLERLIDLLPSDVALPPELTDAAELTAYATTFRDPHDRALLSEEHHEEALRLAEAV